MSIFKKPRGTVASIHFYGTAKYGFDTLIARYGADGEIICKTDQPDQPDFIGTGDKLVPGRSATETLFLAVDELRQRGVTKGTVEIHVDYDFGPRVARIKLEDRIPYFGELKFEAAQVFVVSADAIIANSTKA